MLHANVQHIGWVSDNTAQKTGGRGQGDQRGHGGGRGRGGHGGLELLINAEAGCAVGNLAQEGGRQLYCKSVKWAMRVGRELVKWSEELRSLELEK